MTEEDRNLTTNFVSQKPAENLFIIGDIEINGFDNPIQKLWGDVDVEGQMQGVLLKYAGNFIMYAPE